jgi:hypothetical protein
MLTEFNNGLHLLHKQSPDARELACGLWRQMHRRPCDTFPSVSDIPRPRCDIVDHCFLHECKKNLAVDSAICLKKQIMLPITSYAQCFVSRSRSIADRRRAPKRR